VKPSEQVRGSGFEGVHLKSKSRAGAAGMHYRTTKGQDRQARSGGAQRRHWSGLMEEGVVDMGDTDQVIVEPSAV